VKAYLFSEKNSIRKAAYVILWRLAQNASLPFDMLTAQGQT